MNIEPRDLRVIEELDEALKELEANQNKIHISDFLKYRVLFDKDTLSNYDKNEIRLLSTRFVRQFNPYQPIEVYNDANVLMFKIPQLFIPIKDVSLEYTALVDKFRTDGPSAIPKYSSEATAGLLVAILKSQQNVDDSEYSSYGEYIKALSEEFKNDLKLFDKLKNGEETVSPINETSSVNIENIDGISME